MPIVEVPSGHMVQTQGELMCIVCSRPVQLANATAGSLTANNQQAFAHESHRANRAEWLFYWLQFENRERQLTYMTSGVVV